MLQAAFRGRSRPLQTVLHAAGLLRDQLLRSMTTSAVVSVFAPKAVAAAHLSSATTLVPLSSLLTFSSVASMISNLGQANYAAANSYLDALSRARYARSQGGCSLQLPMVTGAGMGQQLLDDQQQQDAIWALDLKQYASALSAALAGSVSTSVSVKAPLPVAQMQPERSAVPSSLVALFDELAVVTAPWL